MVGTLIRQNFHQDSEDAINAAINAHLKAYYAYLSARFYFSRDSVALKGMEKYFNTLQEQEMNYVQDLIKYTTLRGGVAKFSNIPKPPQEKLEGVEEALNFALGLSKEINQANLDLISTACKHGDAHLEEYVEDDLMPGRVLRIEELGNHLAQLKRAGPGLGVFLFDKKLH